MIQARHRNSLNLDFGSVIQSEENSWICKSEDGKRNYTVILNCQRCDDRQCSLKCSNCNICVHNNTCSCVDFLLYSTICKHIHLVHQYSKRNERETKICEETITERNNDKDEEFIQFTEMVKDKTKSDFALTKTKCLDLLLELSGMVQNTDERHFEAVKHVLNSTVAVKNTSAMMKKHIDNVKLDPAMRITPGKNLEQQRKFF